MLNSISNKPTVKAVFIAGKTITLLFTILFATGLTSSRAQDTWTPKADFGGGVREDAVGFSIGGKGYIGTGLSSDNLTWYNDFWEYDPTTNTWTQKADFGGTARAAAVGFSIGTKGYIGTGADQNGGLTRDFWEYNPFTNSWTEKADFGGIPRFYATGFSIGSKGYIGTGFDSSFNSKKDFWGYDPSANTWTQKADFEGTKRDGAVGFSIGSKGYIGTGFATHGIKKDFWEYDPDTNTWTQKADYGGTARERAVGFSIGSKGYIGTGNNSPLGGVKNDFWEYDPSNNTWTQKANFGGTARWLAVGFSISSKGYIGTGGDGFDDTKDFWEYTPESSTCIIPNVKISPQGNPDICTTGFVNLIANAGNNYSYHWNRNNSDIPGATNQFYHATKTGNYRVRVVDSVGCHGVSKKTVVYTSYRLDDEQSDALALEMKLYPNPTNGQFIIAITLPHKVNTTATIQVINTLGQVVHDEITPVMNGVLQKEIELNDGANGIYLVKVIINDQMYSSQVSYQK